MRSIATRLNQFWAWLFATRSVREWLIVAGVLVALETIVFFGSFSGSAIPQYDFMGAYNLEAFAWWTDGSFFDPPQWMTYMYGGYPAVSNLQNSSFYIPVGLMTIFGPFTLHSSAVLSALHVAFGAIGFYLLARRWGLGFAPALVGLVLWFFVTGFYSGAVYLDFQRAYAWIPWIFLATSVKWDWRKPLAALAGGAILWQAVLAIYPGMLVAIVYTVPVWIIANQVSARPKFVRYLLPLSITAIAAVLMSMLRFLPAILERGNYPAISPDTSEFGVASLGTLLFPYTNPLLTWIPSMQSLFLPAIALPLLAFLPWRKSLVRCTAAVLVVAIALGLPSLPWHDVVTEALPGMTASRFRFSDFKLVILICVALLAVTSLSALMERARQRAQPDGQPERRYERTRAWVGLGLLVLLNVGFALIAVRYHFEARQSLLQWILLAVSSILVLVFATSAPRPRSWSRALAASMVAIAAISGVLSVYSTRDEWRTDRVAAEAKYYGGTVDTFVAKRDAALPHLVQRPARVPAFGPVETEQTKTLGTNFDLGRVFYTGEIGVDGYVNLRGTETFELVKQQLNAEGYVGYNTRAFWNAAGIAIEGAADSIPLEADIVRCETAGNCGPNLKATPVAYDADGYLAYDLRADADIGVMFNEAGYKGWQATLCSAGDKLDCESLPVVRGTSGQITLAVPAGDWRLELHYVLPGLSLAWALFGGSVSVLVAVSLAAAIIRRRTRRSAERAAEPVTTV